MADRMKNIGWVFMGAVALYWAVTTLVGTVWSGPLDPPAAPASTMQTLDELPPAWYKEISGAARFDDTRAQAQGYVLDRETGLVWEEAPSATVRTWYDAVDSCYLRIVGGEIGQSMGWRLPTLQELGTLIEPMAVSALKLPAGHPFTGISGVYWTASTKADNSGAAYQWDSDAGLSVSVRDKSLLIWGGRAWCVRSASGFDISAP